MKLPYVAYWPQENPLNLPIKLPVNVPRKCAALYLPQSHGATWTDWSGNNYHGTISGAYWANGRFGYGLDFDGDNDNVNIGDVTQLNSVSAFTLAFWMNEDVIDAGDHTFQKSKDSNEEIVINLNANGNFRFIVENEAVGSAYFDYSTVYTAKTWAHVVCVFDGTGTDEADRSKIYWNGSEITCSFSGTIPTSTPDTSGNDALIGRTSASFGGILDEFMILSRAATAAEILQWYNWGKLR